jgi:hypothetical protein
MKYAAAVLAVAAAGFAAYAYAQNAPSSVGRYQMVTAGDASVAWRIDTATGAVLACFTAKGSPMAGGTLLRQAGCDVMVQ